MPVTNFRFVVYDQDGTYRHTRAAQDANPALQFNIPADGVEVYRDGDGNCLECTFQAIWPSLMIEERDIVELDIYDGAWIRKYAGMAVKTGNSQVKYDHSAFKLTGLKKRLTEVQINIDAIEEDAALQFLHAVQSAIASGQLVGVTIDAADCLISGIREAKQVTKGRLLGERLDYLASRTNRVWGVDMNRKVYFRNKNAGAMTLNETDPGVLPTFEDTDSEALVTVVPFVLGKDDLGAQLRSTVMLPEAAQFGYATRPDVFLAPEVPVWLPAAVAADYSFTPALNELSAPVAVLYDKLSDFGEGRVVIQFAEVGHDLSSVLTPSIIASRVSIAAQSFGRIVLRAHAGATVTELHEWNVVGTGSVVSALGVFQVPAGTTSLELVAVAGTQLNISEFRAEAMDIALLGTLARIYAELPTRDPATITVLGQVIDPQGNLTLNRADATVYSNPVESVGLHLKLAAGTGVNGGVATVIKAGQKLPAEERAARFLNQRSIQQAAAIAANARS